MSFFDLVYYWGMWNIGIPLACLGVGIVIAFIWAIITGIIEGMRGE